MTEEKNLIVSLGTMAAGEELKLEKLIEDCREKNFGKILDSLLDPRQDALNPAYNSEERELRDRIAGWKERAPTTGSFDLLYIRANGELSEPVRLSETVSSYSDILRQKTRRTEFNEELKYDGMDLVAKFESVGGYK